MKNFAAAAAFLGAFAFATPGPLAQQSQPHQHGESPTGGQAQQNGDFDLRFLDMTAMHHEMGVKMSELAGQKAESAQLKAKATEMAQAQQRDIADVEQLRSTLYPNAPKRQGMSEMHGHMESMGGTGTSGQSGAGHQHEGQSQASAAGQKGGMMGGDMQAMMAEMKRLEKLTGVEFDQAFAKQMIRHHQMQIRMSERATKDAKHDEVREFAQKSITEQKKDISDLERFSGTAK